MYLKALDNKGTLPLFVSMIFLLVSLCLLLGYFVFSVKEKNHFQHVCRIAALESLQYIADATNQLIAMNPKAAKLQNDLKRAKKMLRLAKTPPQIAAAVLYFNKVKLDQKIFRAKQLNIIKSNEKLANQSVRSKQKNGGFLNYNTLLIKAEKYPPLSDSPMYIAYPGFEKKQSLVIEWRKHVSINNKNLKIKGQCMASLYKERKWDPKLIKGKEL
ncbi:MAG: hypothetical protein KDD37_04695 [Bdellovibrionales bacterium]|nr:hypothetical protein [Bdellovibrionales bacterium]